MIIVTGAAGFIGSNLLEKLNREGIHEVVPVDDFSDELKNRNLQKKRYILKVNRDEFFSWFEKNAAATRFVFHLGARTDTTETRKQVFNELNLNYSKKVWSACAKHRIPLIYASSAATYGLGEFGYIDSHSLVSRLKPLNPYGESKNDFDKWVLGQKSAPPYWYGVKFFNVYGPNEYHKDRMASVVFHAFNQVKEKGSMRLFRSHRSDYKDGEQKRDFIYVKDVIQALHFLMNDTKQPGIYNLGTGHARSFLDLAGAVFKALDMPVNIDFIDTPEDIREKYQYFTEANMDKFRSLGWTGGFTPLEVGIEDYIKHYLSAGKYV